MPRIAWMNGCFLPDADARVPFRDRGFTLGDGCFDTARTFAGRPYLFGEHIARLYNSMRLLRIDPGVDAATLLAVTLELVERNGPLLAPGDDWWVTQWVSRGMRADDRGSGASRPTIIVECSTLPFASRAALVRDGADLVTSTVRRPVRHGVPPAIKSLAYLPLVLADLEVQERAPGAWSLALDEDGNLNEGLGSNVFLGVGGRLLTPRAETVLPGLTRATVIDLAHDLGIAVDERDLPPAIAATAEEAFVTSTSLCILPARSFDGRPLPGGAPGPVATRLIAAFCQRLGGFDFREQYLRHLG